MVVKRWGGGGGCHFSFYYVGGCNSSYASKGLHFDHLLLFHFPLYPLISSYKLHSVLK